MKKTDETLNEILKEIKGLRKDLTNLVESITPGNDVISVSQAMKIIGIGNPRYFKWLEKQGVFFRGDIGNKKIYYRSECIRVAEAVKRGSLVIPPIKNIYD